MDSEKNIAIYHDEFSPRFQNNILVRALPPLPTDEDIFNALAVMPPERDAAFRAAPLHYRIDSLSELQDIFIPFPRHTEAFRAMFSAMRACYADRDPQEPVVMRAIMRAMSGQYTNLDRLSKSGGGNGIVLTGCTGVGKTTFVDRFLHNFLGHPVVYHISLNGMPCRWPQIKWIRVQAPSTVSLAWLAESVADRVDALLGTRFGRRFNSQVATSKYVYEMARATSSHLLGLLVVDDTQNIREARGAGDAFVKILCSFMELTGIPVLLITTYKVLPTITRDLMYASKLMARGRPDFPAFEEDDDWDSFVEALWAAHPFPMESEMPKNFPSMLHWHTEGVLRIARELMVELFNHMASHETYIPTMEMMDAISGSKLLHYQHEISALRKLRSGLKFSREELMLYSDFIPPVAGLRQFRSDVLNRDSKIDENKNERQASGVSVQGEKPVKNVAKRASRRKEVTDKRSASLLVSIVRSADPYEACVRQGWVLKDVLELK